MNLIKWNQRTIDNCSKSWLKRVINNYTNYFNYLYDNHLNPLEMREVGCRLIYAIKRYQQLSTVNNI